MDLDLTTACIPWTGYVGTNGYGMSGGKMAHRRAWERVNGPIPAGLTIDHRCHDPLVCKLGKQCPHRRCVNPAHMELCTRGENMLRGGWPGTSITHCRRAGHEYTPANTRHMATGARYCRTCVNADHAAHNDRKRRARCASRGHEPDLRRRSDGLVYCFTCKSANSRNQAAARRTAPTAA